MQQFDREHGEAFNGEKPAGLGFPDTGNGRFSKMLPYKDWLKFNNAQRVHYNFLENLPIILALIVIASFK